MVFEGVDWPDGCRVLAVQERQRNRKPIHNEAVVEQAFEQGISFANKVPCRFRGCMGDHPIQPLLDSGVHARPSQDQKLSLIHI